VCYSVAMARHWDADLKIGDEHIDSHHEEIFHLVSTLDGVIRKNDRAGLGELISFLEHYVVEHFQEEESLMKKTRFKGFKEHYSDHIVFKARIASVRRMFDAGIHTTHVVYGIRQFVDQLMLHIQTIDVKMVGITHVKKNTSKKITKKKQK